MEVVEENMVVMEVVEKEEDKVEEMEEEMVVMEVVS